jgi:hypothetical protein
MEYNSSIILSYHFGTLYKEGKFLELRHDGSLDENGRRKK